MVRAINIFCLLLLISMTLCITNAAGENKSIVVTTSLLKNAIDEVKPESAGIDVTVLLPPASCPGHFDLSPRIIPAIRSASMIIRHDYQDILEKKICDLTDQSLTARVISTDSSPLIPGNYRDIVAEMSDILVELYPGDKEEIEANVTAVNKQIDTFEHEIETVKLKFAGKQVICATHVSGLCAWLGLDVVGILKRPEETTPGDLTALCNLNACLIVCNLQEGTQTAFSLGQKMKIPVVVMSNFPGVRGFGRTYIELLTENTDRLYEKWQKQ
jgi:ABC-type Zn uptake system ZnuABC Zn-binding protein ZnuA